MISGDGDFDSKLDKDKFIEFLDQEWRVKKKSKIVYYHRLSDFLNDQLPNIKITSDQERLKELYISGFINSTSFAITHAMIMILSQYSEFSESELDKMIDASKTNAQIFLIDRDSDVHSFLTKLKELKEVENIPF